MNIETIIFHCPIKFKFHSKEFPVLKSTKLILVAYFFVALIVLLQCRPQGSQSDTVSQSVSPFKVLRPTAEVVRCIARNGLGNNSNTQMSNIQI